MKNLKHHFDEALSLHFVTRLIEFDPITALSIFFRHKKLGYRISPKQQWIFQGFAVELCGEKSQKRTNSPSGIKRDLYGGPSFPRKLLRRVIGVGRIFIAREFSAAEFPEVFEVVLTTSPRGFVFADRAAIAVVGVR